MKVLFYSLNKSFGFVHIFMLNIWYKINRGQVTTYQNSMAPAKVNICKYGIDWAKMYQLLLEHQRAWRKNKWWLKKIFLKANMSEKWGKGPGFTRVNGKAPTAINGVRISRIKSKQKKTPNPRKSGTGWVQDWIHYLWKSSNHRTTFF